MRNFFNGKFDKIRKLDEDLFVAVGGDLSNILKIFDYKNMTVVKVLENFMKFPIKYIISLGNDCLLTIDYKGGIKIFNYKIYQEVNQQHDENVFQSADLFEPILSRNLDKVLIRDDKLIKIMC